MKDTDINELSTVQENTFVNEEPVYFGVLAIDSAVSVNERYGPLIDYLSSEIQRPVELVILSQDNQFTKVEEDTLDFITNNPLAAVQVQRLYETNFLLTHTRPKTGTKFSGLIIVDNDSKITKIEDLRGKRAACVNFQTAAAGCTFQIYHLLQNGFDPYKDFSSFIENKSQDNIVLAVLNGKIDAGFIRTGQLEKMVNKGLLTSLDEVRIIDVAEDNFFYSHTTELYPEWPIAALPDTEPDLVHQVQAALSKLAPDHPALAKLKADGFVPAVDYNQLHDLIETLKLKSWDAGNNAR
ncbi:abc-type phosphate phosphonate transport periplasmic component [Leptolyngbya sp. Heron Island J]|nr:abc-type phosphate phosphonate transport periplasmic component [Leptolyngbya sp. Heron Island J]